MSWFSKHFGITLDKHSLGNLIKNVAPAAAFTPLGVLGAGGLATLGDELRGKNLKQSLLSGVENAALGGGLASLGANVGIGSGAHLGFGLGSGGGSAAGSAGASSSGAAATSAGASAAPTAASFEAAAPAAATPATAAPFSFAPISSAGVNAAPLSLSTGAPSHGLLSTLGKGANFLEHHPNTAAMGLQGLGDIAGAGTEQRLKTAQAAALEASGGLTANELAQRKASQAALSPYWSALAKMPNGRAPIAANPYTTAGG